MFYKAIESALKIKIFCKPINLIKYFLSVVKFMMQAGLQNLGTAGTAST